MKKFRIIICSLIFIFFNSFLCKGQDCEGADTLNIKFFKLEKIPVLSSKKELYRIIGKPNKVLKKKRKRIYFETKGDSLITDTTIYYDVVFYKKYYATYGFNNKNARLISVDFRKTDISVFHNDLTINSKLKFDELVQKYKCSVDSIPSTMAPFLTDNDFPETWDRIIKTLSFHTGENYERFIILYFYKNQLIYLNIDY